MTVRLLEVVVADDGSSVTVRLGDLVAAVALSPSSPAPGLLEVVPDDVWRAVLDAVGRVLADPEADGAADAGPVGLGLAGPDASVVVWDVETLGSPRSALLPGDARLVDGVAGGVARGVAGAAAWLADHEPHTWALVADGRYALGPIASYLLARATRGTWHAVHRSSVAWAPDRLAAVPPDARPEPVDGAPPGAVTDPRVFLGLALPVVRVG